MTERPSWDEWALAIAEVVATRADCTRAQVGAVLLGSDHRLLGAGYNGSPAGVPGCLTEGACPRGRHFLNSTSVGWEGPHAGHCACGGEWPCPEASEPNSDYANCLADHAERNAIRHTSSAELAGCTLYVTRAPCPACWTLIRACDIRRVVTPQGDLKMEEK